MGLKKLPSFSVKGICLMEHIDFNEFFIFDFKSHLPGYLCFVSYKSFFVYFQLVRIHKSEAKEIELCLKK
jgi:hypothetical protein